VLDQNRTVSGPRRQRPAHRRRAGARATPAGGPSGVLPSRSRDTAGGPIRITGRGRLVRTKS